MTRIKINKADVISTYGGKGVIPAAESEVMNDEFENMIRKMGVSHCCEWFGQDESFVIETIMTLCDRSGIELEVVG